MDQVVNVNRTELHRVAKATSLVFNWNDGVRRLNQNDETSEVSVLVYLHIHLIDHCIMCHEERARIISRRFYTFETC